MLSTPEKGEVLFVYLVVTDGAISSVLIREDEKKMQKHIYYVNKALTVVELRYSRLEKIAFALFVTAKKLSAYFQAHPVQVLTDQQVGAVLQNPMSSGRLIKWAMMLTQFNIEYRPRKAVKEQALADFIVECTVRDTEPNGPSQLEEPWWEFSTDGTSGKKECGGGIVLTSPEGFRMYHTIIFTFNPTNNEAEYEALVGGIRLAKQVGAKKVRIRSNSRLVMGQITSAFEA